MKGLLTFYDYSLLYLWLKVYVMVTFMILETHQGHWWVLPESPGSKSADSRFYWHSTRYNKVLVWVLKIKRFPLTQFFYKLKTANMPFPSMASWLVLPEDNGDIYPHNHRLTNYSNENDNLILQLHVFLWVYFLEGNNHWNSNSGSLPQTGSGAPPT